MSEGLCLHCAIMETIGDWFAENGDGKGDEVVVDIVDAVAGLSECIADLVEMAPSRAERRRAEHYARKALDAAFEAQRTGKAVAVETPPSVN